MIELTQKDSYKTFAPSPDHAPYMGHKLIFFINFVIIIKNRITMSWGVVDRVNLKCVHIEYIQWFLNPILTFLHYYTVKLKKK